MRLRKLALWGVLVFGGSLPGLAQQATGPATLEGLLHPAEAQGPAADAGPKRPAGAVARPKDGVQYPDLDKAWTDYDAAVAKAAESLKTAITEQFDDAAAKGDLGRAETWQAALERFEKDGELPSLSEARTAVMTVNRDWNKARDGLAKAYDAVVQALTMAKQIEKAKATRDEWQTCSGAASAANADKPQDAVVPAAKQPVVVGRWRRVSGVDMADCDFRPDGSGRVDSHRVIWKQTGPNSFRFDFPDHPKWFMKVVDDNGVITGVLDNGFSVRFIKVK